MTGMKLQFDGLTGWRLLPGEVVSGFEATVQVALVVLGTVRGDNRVLPDAGTDLLIAGVTGLMSDLQSTKHQANFAAAETLELINNNTTDGTGLSGVWLEVQDFAPPSVAFNAAFRSETQEQIGITLSVS